MKVTTACAWRYHLFDQAKQLFRNQYLYRFITTYPKYKTREWGIDDNSVKSNLHKGILYTTLVNISKHSSFSYREKIIKYMHSDFASSLVKDVPKDTEVLISHSSYMFEALDWAKSQNILTIVDHGSLHEQYVNEIMLQENSIYGFSTHGNSQFNWLVERENNEFNNADYIFTCSELAKQTLVKNGIKKNKIFVNNLGTDLTEFSPGLKHDNIFRIIYCGAIVPQKGIHYLIQAFVELALPKSELWLVGGFPKDPVLYNYIKNSAEKNVILKGSFPQARLKYIYNQGSVFILPSLADGWGMVVIQAMACGLPVIVTEQTGAKEAVVNGENGYIIPTQSVESLKERILLLYNNNSLRIDLGANAMNSIKTRFTWDNYGDRLKTIMHSIT